MKKIIAIILSCLTILALFAGCDKKEEPKESVYSTPVADSSKPAANPNNNISAIGTGKEDTATGTEGADLTETKVYPSDDAVLKLPFDAEPLGMTAPGEVFAKDYNQTRIFGDTLLFWDSNDNSVKPKLATEWEWVSDRTLRLKLVQNATSHAGDPFTAYDVVFSFQLGCDNSANSTYFGFIDMENTKAIDDYTVEISCKDPYPYLTQDLTNAGAYTMVVEKTYNDIGGREAAKDDPSAQTGPYKLVKWDHGICVYTERRDDYWGRMPYYKYIEEYTVTDPNTRVMGVEAGDYDIDFMSSSTAVLNADGKTAKGWSLNSVGTFTVLMLNSDLEPLNVKECRQAISLAIDRESLLKVCVDGLGFVTDSIYGPLHPGYQPAGVDCENYYRYDVEAAKQKLIDAGYPNGFEINCKYRSAAEVNKAAEALHSMLSQIGIDLQLTIQESATWYADMRSGNWNTHLSSGGNPNPSRLMTSVNPASTHNEATGCSGAHWDEIGKVPELITKCLTTIDEAERNSYLAEFQDICREYVPMVTLFCKSVYIYSNPSIYYIGTDVRGAMDFLSPYPAEYIGA